LIWVVKVQKLLKVAGKMSRSSIMHKPPVAEAILLLKNVNKRPLRVKEVACKVLFGYRQLFPL
jgi:hypothetical protein